MKTDRFANLTWDLEHYPDLVNKSEMIRSVRQMYGRDSFRYKSPLGHIDIIEYQRTIDESYITHLFYNDNSFFYDPPSSPNSPLLRQTKEMLDRYFSGKPVDFSEIPIRIDWSTFFQNWVWDAIREIPYGEVRSYKWIAEKIGRPKSSRAVGNATGMNPVSIVIPCHRVIGSDRSLGGYGGGIERKQRLLTIEKFPIKELKKPRKGAYPNKELKKPREGA